MPCLSSSLSLLAALVEVILRKANPILILIRQLFHSYSHFHSHSLPASWVPRGTPTSENAPSHGHKTYRDRDLRREEHLSEPTHTLGRHRARANGSPCKTSVSIPAGKGNLDEIARSRLVKVHRGVVGAAPPTSTRHAHAAFNPARQMMATDGNRPV